jgi:hypothetical protein
LAAQGHHRRRGQGADRSRRGGGGAGHLRAAGVLSPGDDARRWLDDHPGGARPDDVLTYFDSLPTVVPDELIGRWRGSGLPSGSPLDGLLESYGWYGKEIVDAETVHALLFRDRSGRPRPVDPALLPVGLLREHAALAHLRPARTAFGGIRPLLHTARPTARVRTVEHRGVHTAAIVYDALPIIDVLRRVTPETLVGFMDLRGLPQPFFFLLRRD